MHHLPCVLSVALLLVTNSSIADDNKPQAKQKQGSFRKELKKIADDAEFNLPTVANGGSMISHVSCYVQLRFDTLERQSGGAGRSWF